MKGGSDVSRMKSHQSNDHENQQNHQTDFLRMAFSKIGSLVKTEIVEQKKILLSLKNDLPNQKEELKKNKKDLIKETKHIAY